MSFTFEDMKEKIKYGINYGNALECFIASPAVSHNVNYGVIDSDGIIHPVQHTIQRYSTDYGNYEKIGDPTIFWSTEEVWDNPETTKSLIDYYAGLGFTAMRLPVNLWWYYNLQTGGTDERWLNYIDTVVGWIIDAGMFCLIDMHCENYVAITKDLRDDYADLENSDRFNSIRKRWTALAVTLKHYPEDSLAFELLNEFTFGGGYDHKNDHNDDCHKLTMIYSKLIEAIRATGDYNTDRLIGIDGYRGDNSITAEHLHCFNDILKDKRNFVCVTGYLLSEFTFCYNESFGKKTFLDLNNDPDYDMRRSINDMCGTYEINSLGYNQVAVEYGTYAYNEFTGTEEEIQKYREGCARLTYMERNLFKKLDIPCFVWDTGYIVDRKNCTIKSPELYDVIFDKKDSDMDIYVDIILKSLNDHPPIRDANK